MQGMGGLVHRRHASCLQQEAASAAAGAQEAEDVGTTHVPVISGPGAELDVAGSAVALEDGGDGPEARHSDSGSRGAWLGQLEGKQREMRRQESPRWVGGWGPEGGMGSQRSSLTRLVSGRQAVLAW
jgi:protein tyrosine phosphatase (PTP) superfamily phosphohydrolase (DUF442 family)